MKRFEYTLDHVLDYKVQILDNLRNEHAVILESVHKKQDEITHLNHSLEDFEKDFDQTKSKGAAIRDFRLCDMCIGRMEEIIQTEEQKLTVLKEKEEGKKKEVITAKVDSSKFEHLKKRKYQEYQITEKKAEEAFVEDFISRVMIKQRSQNR